MIKKLKNYIHMKGYLIKRIRPRPSTRYIKKFFGNKELVGIEIGSHIGVNAKDMLKILNIKKLYIIDPYTNYDGYGNVWLANSLNEAEEEARERLKKYKDKIVWIKDFSDNAIHKVLEKVDFVYIDGNHAYNFAFNDMTNYYKILKDKGILAGHDIEDDNVLRAFADFCCLNKIQPHLLYPEFMIIKDKSRAPLPNDIDLSPNTAIKY